jgi:hypothetical protein
MPMLGLDRDGVLVGAASGREEPLGLHSWWGTLLVQPLTGQVYGDLAYTNQDTPLALTGRVFRQDRTRWGRPGDPLDDKTYWARFQGASLGAQLPLLLGLASDRVNSLDLKAEAVVAGLKPVDPLAFPGAEYAGISGEAAWQWVSQRPLDLFPSAGFALTLGGQAALPGRVYDGRRGRAGVQVFVPGLGAHQALVLGARGAKAAGVLPESPLDAAPRGYQGGRFTAGQQLTVAAAYRAALAAYDRGPGLIPIYFYGLWAEVFTEWGTGWEGALSAREWAQQSVGSVGLLAHLQMQWFWYLPAFAEAGVTFRTEKHDAVLLGTVNLGF